MKRILKIFGIGGHNCKEIVEKVEILLDGELDKATQEKLIKEIKRCPSCLEHYEIDEAFKKFVCQKLERKNCTNGLKAEILDKIKNIDAENK